MTRRRTSDRTRAPLLLRATLGRLLPRRERAHLLIEMDELHRRRRERVGPLRAGLWYVVRGAGFPLRFLLATAGRRILRMGEGTASLGRELRQGARVLRRRPGYAAATVLTLGIGVGALATVYSAAHWTLLRPVPGVRAPHELATVQLEVRADGSPAFPVSGPDLRTLHERIGALSALEGSVEVEVNLDPGSGTPARRARAAALTSGFLPLLGVAPARGRLPGAADESETVLVGYRLWHELWGGSPSVLGATIRVNGHPFEVVGVAPRGFQGAALAARQELWFPAGAVPALVPGIEPADLDRRSAALWTGLVGRLTPGTTPEGVREEAARTMEAIRTEHGWDHSFAADFVLQAYPGLGIQPRLRASVERTLTLLAGASGLLLLLCLANVGNLAFTHHVARAGSLAVHGALGAGRGRLARRVLAEHVLLGAGGALAGLLLARVAHAWLRRTSLSTLGVSLEGIVVEPRVVGLAMAAAVAGSLGAGLGPALAASRGGLSHVLPGAGAGHGRPTRRLQAGLVVAQVALSATLLVGGGLMLRTVIALHAVPLGFDTERTLRFSLDPRIQGWDEDRVRGLVTAVEVRLAGEPGVIAAGFVAPVPVRPAYLTLGLHPDGRPSEDPPTIAAQLEVTSGFLAALGTRVTAGESFAEVDTRAPPSGLERPVLLTRALADGLFPDRLGPAVVGERLQRPYPRGSPPLRVLGVLDDVRLTGLRGQPTPLAVLPWGEGIGEGEITGWVRVTGQPASWLPRVRAALAEVAPDLPVYGLGPVRDRVNTLMAEERVVAHLALALAGAGLLLAGLGLHSVLAYTVTERRREIGVRVALGASPRRLVGRVAGQGLGLAALGATLGLAGAYALTRLLEARLFGVAGLDPLTYALGVALLLATAAAAAWAPARRATRVPVREALSAE